MTTFKDYLTGSFAKDYTGTDDNMPDAFDGYIEGMDDVELIANFFSYTESHSEKEVARQLYELLA